MDASGDNNETYISDLSEEELKHRLIEGMQYHTFMHNKSDSNHPDRDKQIAVYKAIEAILGLECK